MEYIEEKSTLSRQSHDRVVQLENENSVLKKKLKQSPETLLQTITLNSLFTHGREVVLYVANDVRQTVEAISDSISSYGYAPDDFTSGKRSLREITYAEDVRRVENDMSECLSKKVATFDLDYRIICKSGDPVWITCVVLPEYDQDGKASHFLMKIKDISKHKQHEDQLEHMFVTLKSIGEAVIQTDACGCIDRLNRAAAKLVGLINPKARRKLLNDVIRFSLSSDFSTLIDPLKTKAETGEIISFDEIFVQCIYNEKEFRASCNISPIYTGKVEKKLIGYVLVVKDLTALYNVWQAARENEAKIQESEITMRSFFDHSMDGIVLADQDGIVREWSKGYEKITGVTKEMAIGKLLWDVVLLTLPVGQQVDKERKRLQDEVDLIVTKKLQKMLTRYVVNRQTGEQRTLHVLYFPVVFAGKTMMGAISRDVTQVMLSQELVRQNEQKLIIEKNRLQTLGDHFPNGCLFRMEVDQETKKISFSYLSKTWEQLTGITVEDAVKDINVAFSKIHPDDLKQLIDGIQGTWGTQENFDSELRCFKNKNELRWLQTSAHRHLENGRMVSDGFILDITERKQNEIALSEYHENLEKLVKERTEEFELVNEELSATNEELSTANEKLDQKNKQLQYEVVTRRQIMQELEDSESKVRNFIQQSFEGIMILDNQGRIVEWNHALEKITGVSREKAIGKREWELLRDHLSTEGRAPGFYNKLLQSRWDYIKGGREQAPIVEELVLNLPDGPERYVQASMFPIGLAKTCLFGRILRDITEQKLTYQELEQYRTQLEQMVETKTSELVTSQERLSTLSDNLPGGVVYQMIEKGIENTQFTHISAYSANMFGISAEDMMADITLFYKSVYPEDIAKLKDCYTHSVEQHEDMNIEFRILLETGEIKWAHMRAGIHEIEDGSRVWDGFMIDVTDRKHTEEALQQSEAMYRQLITDLPDAVVMCDLNRQVNLISPKVKELFRINEGVNIKDLRLGQYIHPNDRKQAYHIFEKLEKSNVVFLPQLLMLRKDGSEFFGEITSASIKGADGKISSVIMVIRDITQRKQNETELMQAKEKAEESDKLKSAFLANMSHEIRTPVNGIIGFLNFLSSDNLPSKRRQEYIRIIHNSSAQLVKLIDDIVDVAKIEAQQLDIRPTPCDVNDLMRELLMFFETYLYNSNKTRVALILDDSQFIDSCVAFVDSGRLRQILSNLINNAIKFTEKGYIRFGYRQSAFDQLEFFVEDSGIGLTKKQLGVIFERFHQAEHSSNRRYGGAGLGLTISQSLVQLMGGDIHVESAEGDGSSFYFTVSYIPVSFEDVHLFDLDGKISSRKPFGGKNILLIEPITIKYKYYEKMLLATGASVTRVKNIQQWLDSVDKTNHIHAIVSDVSVFKGLDQEAIRKVRSARVGLPMILTMAGEKIDYKKSIRDSQCDTVLQEPIYYKGMLRALKKHLK